MSKIIELIGKKSIITIISLATIFYRIKSKQSDFLQSATQVKAAVVWRDLMESILSATSFGVQQHKLRYLSVSIAELMTRLSRWGDDTISAWHDDQRRWPSSHADCFSPLQTQHPHHSVISSLQHLSPLRKAGLLIYHTYITVFVSPHSWWHTWPNNRAFFPFITVDFVCHKT